MFIIDLLCEVLIFLFKKKRNFKVFVKVGCEWKKAG